MCVHKERTCKDDFEEVAENITKEGKEVTRIATVTAGACIMSTVGGANDTVDWALQHNIIMHASGAGKGCQYQLKYLSSYGV